MTSKKLISFSKNKKLPCLEAFLFILFFSTQVSYAMEVMKPEESIEIISEGDINSVFSKVFSRSKDVTIKDIKILKNGEKVKLMVDKAVRFEGGLTLTFTGHSHKRTKAGQKSPLGIYIKYSKKGEDYSEGTWIYPGEDKLHWWVWRDHLFKYVDHGYDEYQEIEFSKLPIKDVEKYISDHKSEKV